MYIVIIASFLYVFSVDSFQFGTSEHDWSDAQNLYSTTGDENLDCETMENVVTSINIRVIVIFGIFGKGTEQRYQ